MQWWRVAQGGPSRNTQAVIAERIQCLSRPRRHPIPQPVAGVPGAVRGWWAAQPRPRPCLGKGVEGVGMAGVLALGRQCSSVRLRPGRPRAEQSGANARCRPRLASLRRHGGLVPPLMSVLA